MEPGLNLNWNGAQRTYWKRAPSNTQLQSSLDRDLPWGLMRTGNYWLQPKPHKWKVGVLEHESAIAFKETTQNSWLTLYGRVSILHEAPNRGRWSRAQRRNRARTGAKRLGTKWTSFQQPRMNNSADEIVALGSRNWTLHRPWGRNPEASS